VSRLITSDYMRYGELLVDLLDKDDQPGRRGASLARYGVTPDQLAPRTTAAAIRFGTPSLR
jgi:hypothetical protein